MKVTVGICTWNNSTKLEHTLEAIGRLDTTGFEHEVIVVDNNSTDDTAQVLAAFRDRLPLRSLFEPQQGVSYARNRIQAEARGELLCWTDDDAIPELNWLQAYVQAAEKWPDVDFFGGPVTAHWEERPPGWILRGLNFLEGVMAIRDLGPEPIPLTAERLPFGVNMVFRREQMKQYRFPTHLGVTGEKRLSGEETVVFRQALDDGCKGRWVPSARVQHHVPAQRTTWSYIRKYYRGYGQSSWRKRAGPPGKMQFLGAPLWLWRQWMRDELSLWWKRVFTPPETWVPQLIRASASFGAIQECLDARRAKPAAD